MRKLSKLIAIVDDHFQLRKQLSTFVSYHGFTVLFDAGNGKECLSQMQEQVMLPDLCIVDVKMPEMDGYDTARMIKQCWPDVRVVLYSMRDDEQAIQKAFLNGADAFVGKWWQPEEILRTIRGVLGLEMHMG